MSTRISSLLIFLTFFILPVADGLAQDCSPEGNWMAVINRRKVNLRVGLHIEKTPKGDLKGYMISPDQTTDQYALDAVRWEGDSLVATCKKAALTLRARMSAGCDSLHGDWVQPVVLKMKWWRVDELPKISRPQEPFPPFPYNTEEVTFANKRGGFQLAGTLSTPRTEGPWPLVILISGSGPQNRDEELLGHKPFLVIADHLTKNGIAVLRYDDRGTAKSGGVFNTATSFDFAEDVESAIRYIKGRKDLKISSLGLIGHSEGGMIAPVVASRNSKVDFIVLLAGPGTTGKQILISQSELIGRADSVPEQELQDNLRIARLTYEIIEKEKEPLEIAAQIRAMVKKETEGLTPAEKEAAGLTDMAVSGMIMQLTTSWFTTFVRFDPAVYLKKVKCPVLAINGEKDLQVPAEENLAAIEAALKSGKCRNYGVMKLRGLNHLFQHCYTGSPTEYISIAETISPDALKVITDWIKERQSP